MAPEALLLEFMPGDVYEFKSALIEFGLLDDPTDERIEMYVTPGHYYVTTSGGQMPSFDEQGADAIWMGMQGWRTVGTPATVVDVLEEHSVEWDEGEAEFMLPRGDAYPIGATGSNMPDYGLVLWGKGTVTSDYIFSWIVWYDVVYIQMNYRDDPAEWDGYQIEESYADDIGEEDTSNTD